MFHRPPGSVHLWLKASSWFLFLQLSQPNPPDINCSDVLGNTPLHCSAYRWEDLFHTDVMCPQQATFSGEKYLCYSRLLDQLVFKHIGQHWTCRNSESVSLLFDGTLSCVSRSTEVTKKLLSSFCNKVLIRLRKTTKVGQFLEVTAEPWLMNC